MKYSQMADESSNEAGNKNGMDGEGELIERLNSITENEEDVDPDFIEILLSIKDIISEASYYQTFTRVDERYFRDISHNLTESSCEKLSYFLSGLATELCRSGILEGGEKMIILSHRILEENEKKPPPPILLRHLDTLFSVGFFTAKEEWFIRALDMFKSFKKDLNESIYQEQVLRKFSKWVQVSEISKWKNAQHRLNFEMMMMKFSRGEI